MIQPRYVPQFATEAFTGPPSNPEIGLAPRDKPPDSWLAAGFRANERRPARFENWLMGNGLDHLAALADAPALDWSGFGTTHTDGFDQVTSGFTSYLGNLVKRHDAPWLLASSLDDKGYPILTTWGGSDGMLTSRDGVRWLSKGDAPSGVGALLGFGANVVFFDGGNGVYRSTDGAGTWSVLGTLPSSGSWQRLGRAANGFLVAGGIGKIATSPDGVTWTARSIPGTWTTDCLRICTARSGESGVGAIALGWNSGTLLALSNVLQSLDGVTWSQVTLPGFWGPAGAASACWSESHQRWYLLGTTGEICSTPDLATPWTRHTDLDSYGSQTYHDIAAHGRNLVICGDAVRALSSDPARGSILVLSDPSAVDANPRYVLSPFCGSYANVGDGKTEDDPFFQRLIHHDGRLLAVRARTVATNVNVMECAMSARAPWLGGNF